MAIKRWLGLISFILFYHLSALANSDAKSAPSLHASYSFRDFQYRSDITDTGIQSIFDGTSNLYVVGENNISINDKWTFGVFLFQVDTDMSISILPEVTTLQTVRTRNFFGHVMGQLSPHFYVNLNGGGGNNVTLYQSLSIANLSQGAIGYARSESHNAFGALKGIYNNTFDKWTLTASANVLYSQVNQGGFPYFFATPVYLQRVTSSSWLLQENSELSYKWSDTFSPFITGGLLQVLDFYSSTPLASVISIGTAPEININQNGFEVGVGFSYAYKKLTFRFEQQYYQRGTVYHSNISILTMRYSMD